MIQDLSKCVYAYLYRLTRTIYLRDRLKMVSELVTIYVRHCHPPILLYKYIIGSSSGTARLGPASSCLPEAEVGVGTRKGLIREAATKAP